MWPLFWWRNKFGRHTGCLLVIVFAAWQAPQSLISSLAHTIRCGSSSRQTVSATCWDSKQHMKVMQAFPSEFTCFQRIRGEVFWEERKKESSLNKDLHIFFSESWSFSPQEQLSWFLSVKADWVVNVSSPFHLLCWRRVGEFQLMATDSVCGRKWDEVINGSSRLASTALNFD